MNRRIIIRILVSGIAFLCLIPFTLFSQIQGYDYSSIPEDTVIISNKNATIKLYTPNGEKVIHYVDSKHAAEVRRHKTILLGLSGILILLTLGTIYWSRAKKRKILELEAMIENGHREIRELQDDIEAIRKHSDSLSKSVMKLIEERVNIIKTLIDKHDFSEEKVKGGSFFDKYEALQDTVKRYNEYIDQLRKDTDLTSGMEAALNTNCNGVMDKLRHSLGNKLTEEDYRIISCIFIGMTPKSISFVTGIPAGTIRVKKTRLKERIEALPDSSDKRLFLHLLGQKKQL